MMNFRYFLYRIYLSWGWKDLLPADSKAFVIDPASDLTPMKLFPGTDDLYYKETVSGVDEIGKVLKSRFDSNIKNSMVQVSFEMLENHYTLYYQPYIGGKIYFLYFIEESLDYIEDLTETRKRIILEWVMSKKKVLEKAHQSSLTGITQDNEHENSKIITTLVDAFSSTSDYYKIMNLLIENDYCYPDTFSWKDENKGRRGLLVALIKQLHHLGYYKIKRQLNHNEIELIARNTFRMKVSTSTIKHIKSTSFNNPFSFIPLKTVNS